MKKRPLIKATCLLVSALLLGCDVTDDELGNGSNVNNPQAGDPVVVDFAIAYIERPVPLDMEDADSPVMVMPDNILDPTEFRPGARIVIKDRAAVSASTRVITDEVFAPEEGQERALYDVRDLSVNSDGTKLLFSMRAPEIRNADDDEQPTWNIWEYDRTNDSLNRIIASDITAEQGHDRYPIYLPDDSIVFSSTRQRNSKSLLLDQSRPQYAYVTEADDESRAFTLHRIEDDRLTIEQISYGKGHDIQPTVLENGRIMFVRGDDTSNEANNRNILSLYSMKPDGSDVTLEYGFHSPSGSSPRGVIRGALTKPMELREGGIMVTFRPRESTRLGGDIYKVDVENYVDLTTPTRANLGAEGPAEESLSVGEVILEGQSPHGYFNSAYPLFDGTDRLIVSWMPCLVLGYRLGIYVDRIDTPILNDDDEVIGIDTTYQLINSQGQLVDELGDPLAEGAAAVEITADQIVSLPCATDTFDNPSIEMADPQFGIWVYDPNSQTQNPVVFSNSPGTMYTEAVAFEPRRVPSYIAPASDTDDLSRELAEENVGVLHIRSIYDLDGTDRSPNGIAAMADPLQTAPDSRPIRFVRFYEEANMPHEDDYEIETDLVGGAFNNPGRSIIGYAQVHPDGSVKTKLPANVQFSMEFVDANGRRVMPRKNYWLNLRPGEVRSCNGCHTPGSKEPHGRQDAEMESANEGALAVMPFPNTHLQFPTPTPTSSPILTPSPSATPLPEVGETMAEYYVRMKQLLGGNDPLAPSLDLIFTDEWTDQTPGSPGAGAVPAADIDIRFGDPDNLKTAAPVKISGCLTSWNSLCRTVIDYPDHIQPIFEVSRIMNVEEIDTETSCISCHSRFDANGDPQAPAGRLDKFNDNTDNGTARQLDFVRLLDDDGMLLGYSSLVGNQTALLNPDGTPFRRQLFIDGEPQYVMEPDATAEGELLFYYLAGDGVVNCYTETVADQQGFTPVLDDLGVHQQCLIRSRDEDGNLIPELAQDGATQNRYLNAAGANDANNQRFFNTFAEDGYHAGALTPAELKLFSEWLDMGGQYYNEIFKAVDD